MTTPLPWLTLSLEDLRSALLDLFCAEAYQEGDFTLSSGQKSTYYINSKPVTLHPQGAIGVGRLLWSLVPPGTQAVAGLTLGADPLVMAVSLMAALDGQAITPLIVRKEAKGHGTRAYIEGPTLPEGSSIVVLEDVVTTGRSALQAVERLQGAGYQVTEILALVDRQQGGEQCYQEAKLGFQSLFQLPELQARWRELQAGVAVSERT